MTLFHSLDSPVGNLLLVRQGDTLTGLYFRSYAGTPVPAGDWQEDPAAFTDTVEQLEAYFRGERQTFDVPTKWTGTPFQLQVWEAVNAIPYGAVANYRQIAEAIGKPAAVRAVGTAIGRNPLCIIGPCHRVIGSDGGLGGYAGGLTAKRYLLELERQSA